MDLARIGSHWRQLDSRLAHENQVLCLPCEGLLQLSPRMHLSAPVLC